MQRAAQSGDRVRVAYTGRFDDGSVFDSSEGQPPLEFTLGAGEVIAGFDSAVLGLKTGESRTIDIAPEDGYGVHLPEMVAEVERRQIPDDHLLEIGNYLEVSAPNGICFSPDYKRLYIADTGTDGRDTKVWDIDGKTARNGKRFIKLDIPGTGAPSAFDGIRCDVDGNVWGLFLDHALGKKEAFRKFSLFD